MLSKTLSSVSYYLIRFLGDKVATPRALKNILGEAYANRDDVTDEIVDIILKPGLLPGAVDVFLDFISYR
jgi:hypothetical protein